MLLATRHSPLATRHSPRTTHHAPLTTHHSPYPNPNQVLVHELGAVLSFESPSTPLAIGETVDVAPTAAGELSVV